MELQSILSHSWILQANLDHLGSVSWHKIVKADKTTAGDLGGGAFRCSSKDMNTREPHCHPHKQTLSLTYTHLNSTHTLLCKISCYISCKYTHSHTPTHTHLIVHIHERTYRVFRFARLTFIVSLVCMVFVCARWHPRVCLYVDVWKCARLCMRVCIELKEPGGYQEALL